MLTHLKKDWVHDSFSVVIIKLIVVMARNVKIEKYVQMIEVPEHTEKRRCFSFFFNSYNSDN